MTDRVATPPPSRSRPPAARLLLALGILAGAGIVAAAQPPVTTNPDDRSPRPAGERSRPVEAQKYQIPNKDRAIFQGHRDPGTGTGLGWDHRLRAHRRRSHEQARIRRLARGDPSCGPVQLQGTGGTRRARCNARRTNRQDRPALPARTASLRRQTHQGTPFSRFDVAAEVGYTGDVRGVSGPARRSADRNHLGDVHRATRGAWRPYGKHPRTNGCRSIAGRWLRGSSSRCCGRHPLRSRCRS